MHSRSMIMAARCPGSTYDGGVRLGPISDRSSCNAMQASLWHEGRVQRDLSGQPRSLRWPSQNPLPRTSTLKHCKLPCPYTNRANFALQHLCAGPHCSPATHLASDARCIAFGQRQSHMACGLHEAVGACIVTAPTRGSAALHAPRACCKTAALIHTQTKARPAAELPNEAITAPARPAAEPWPSERTNNRPAPPQQTKK